jgi:AAA domain
VRLFRVRPEDKVLLVGDVKQHEAVEAGSPFAQLQRHGLETAKLDEIVRQEESPLRKVVKHFSVGEIKEAVDGLREQGRITEIDDPDERLKAIAKDYCKEPDSTLVISPANKERVELNRLIHQQLQKDGQVFSKNYTTKVLENRNDMTGAERTVAASYQKNDVVRYTSSSKKHGISAGEYARVLSTNDKTNEITVKLDKSQREVTYNPQRLQGVTVYREAERQFSENDRIQFRAPYHPVRVANGELGTLEKIEKGTLTVTLDSGRKVSFPIEKNRHIDHGYAVTSYSSQGQTVNRVLVNADTSEPDKLLNQRMAYVAASHARLDARIYTGSDERLSAALARQVDKSTALEASRETKARNIAQLIPIEPTPQPKPQPIHAERQAGTERPPAQRTPQPGRSEAVKQTVELSPFDRELQRFAQELAADQTPHKTLPVPDKPPARSYTVIRPVDENMTAAEMSAEIVQLANANRLALTEEGISAPVQRVMQASLMNSATQPPLPEQLQRIARDCEALRLTEKPEPSSMLQASLWRAYNAPDSSQILENLTVRVETHIAQQQSITQAPEPTFDNEPSLDYDSGPSMDFG